MQSNRARHHEARLDDCIFAKHVYFLSVVRGTLRYSNRAYRWKFFLQHHIITSSDRALPP